MFPDGRAAKLMGEIQFPCAHCGGAVREPLTLAATRHARSPRAVLEAFRALEDGGPDRGAARRRTPCGSRAGSDRAVRCSARGRRRGAHDVGRALARAFRGRGAPSRRGPVHRRPRAGSARLACGDRPLAARAREHDRRPDRRARGRRRASACSPERTSSGSRSRSPRHRRRPSRITRRQRARRATSASPSPSSSHATGTSPRTRPSSSLSTTSRSMPSSIRSTRRRSTTARSTTATSTRRSHGPISSSGRRSVSRGSRACRSSASASSATGTRRPDRLTAWANFQGPFTLHGVAAAALGLRGDRLRLLTPPDSGGSFGIKAAVLPYVVLLGLASRALGVPVRWTEDRLEHLAASSAATGRATTVEAGFMEDGELVALRYDAIEDVGAYVRAPEPATLYRMHGSLSGAYGVRDVAARYRVVLTNTLPSGLNRGFGGPQLYFGLERVMAIAASRLGLDPAELARRNLVPAERCRTGRRRDRCTTRGTTRRASTARSSWRATTSSATASRVRGRTVGCRASGSPASSSRRSRTWATSRSPRRRSSARASCRSRGTRRVRRWRSTRSAGSPSASGRPHRVRGIAPCARRWSPTSSVARRRTSRCCPSSTRRRRPGRSRPGTTPPASPGSAWGRFARGEPRSREDRRDPRPRRRARSCSLRKVAGMAHWNPEGLPEGMDPGLARVAFWAAPNLDPPDAEDRVASSAAHGFLVDVCAVEIDAETGAVEVTDYVTVHDAGVLLNPLLADGQIARRPRARRGGRALRAPRLRRVGRPDDRSLVDYLTPTAPDLPVPRIGHLSRRRRSRRSARRGWGRGTRCRSGRDRQRRRGRARTGRRRAAAHAATRLGPIHPVDGEAAPVRVRPRRAPSRRRSRRSPTAATTRSRSRAARASSRR